MFLDRDGTLVEEVSYLHDPAEVALLPGVAGALAALAAAGYARACRCRKPAPGMLQAAAGRLGLDLGASYLIGNDPSDVAAALAAGATPLFVTTGRAAGRRPPVGAAAFPSLRRRPMPSSRDRESQARPGRDGTGLAGMPAGRGASPRPWPAPPAARTGRPPAPRNTVLAAAALSPCRSRRAPPRSPPVPP